MNRALTRLTVALVVATSVAWMVAPSANALRRASFPVQSVGDRGIDVTAIQHLLRASGHPVEASGYFGLQTRIAVQSFQTDASLSAHGIVDAATWQRLVPRLTETDSGEAVVALKKLLNAKRRAELSLDAPFDTATRQAVRDFQDRVDLPANGTVDLETWRNLAWHYVRPDFKHPGLCNYDGGNYTADWGTGAAIGQLEAAAELYHERTDDRIGVGDVSFWHGGPIVFHATHEVGLDVDISMVRKDRRQCNKPSLTYRSPSYDRAATREMIRAVYDVAGAHVKLIYFNDPVLVAEGLVQRYPRHDDHIHIRFCEAGHARRLYLCPEGSLDRYLGNHQETDPQAWERPSTSGAGYGG